MSKTRYAVIKTSAKLPYGTNGIKWLAAGGHERLEESIIMACDKKPETLREYARLEDAQNHLYDHMREIRFIKTTALFKTVLLAETLNIEERLYDEKGGYTVENVTDIYCPIPNKFDREQMLFPASAEKDFSEDDDDDDDDMFD